MRFATQTLSAAFHRCQLATWAVSRLCNKWFTDKSRTDVAGLESVCTLSSWSPCISSVPDLQMVQHMFNCILLPPSNTGSRPLRGSRSSYTPTTDQTNAAIFISAQENHCKGTDPPENRALIAVPFKPNVIAAEKADPKVHWQPRPACCTVASMSTEDGGTKMCTVTCTVPVLAWGEVAAEMFSDSFIFIYVGEPWGVPSSLNVTLTGAHL